MNNLAMSFKLVYADRKIIMKRQKRLERNYDFIKERIL